MAEKIGEYYVLPSWLVVLLAVLITLLVVGVTTVAIAFYICIRKGRCRSQLCFGRAYIDGCGFPPFIPQRCCIYNPRPPQFASIPCCESLPYPRNQESMGPVYPPPEAFICNPSPVALPKMPEAACCKCSGK